MTQAPVTRQRFRVKTQNCSSVFCCPITLKCLNNGAIQKMSPVWSVKETQTQNQVSSAVSGMHYSCRPLSWRAWSCPVRRRRRTLRVEENRRFPFSASLEVLQFRTANGSNPTSSFVHWKTLALAIIITMVSKTFAVVIMFPLCRYHVRLTTATYCPGMHTTDHSGLWAEIVFDTWPSARGTEFWKCRVNGAFKILPLILFCSRSKLCTKVINLQSSTLV